jgi:hypothetical protein
MRPWIAVMVLSSAYSASLQGRPGTIVARSRPTRPGGRHGEVAGQDAARPLPYLIKLPMAIRTDGDFSTSLK